MKKAIIGIIISVLVIAGIYFVVTQQGSGPVKVYPGNLLGIGQDYNNSNIFQGTVIADQLQAVYVSSTQTITEILVTEGQSVKKGDLLLTYDSTLSELSLTRKKLEIQKLDLSITNANKQLAVIKTYKPGVPIIIDAPLTMAYDEDKTPQLLGGTGTLEDPFIYRFSDDLVIDNAFMDTLLLESDEVFVDINIYYQEKLLQVLKMQFTKEEGINKFKILQVVLITPEPEPQPEPEPEPIPEPEPGIILTAAEIFKMRTEKEAEIRDLMHTKKATELELVALQEEISSNFIVAELDGIVGEVIDAQTALNENRQLLQVSSSGSFIVSASIGELDLESYAVGDKMLVLSYETGASVEGEIISISKYPAAGGDPWGNSSATQSFYPMKISVDKSADLRPGMWVEVQPLTNQSEPTPFFAHMNAFIRTDDGAPYVWLVRDNKLTKREVTLGRKIEGMYTQILDEDITIDDLFAFPYGKGLREGARIEEGTIEDLYNPLGG